MGAFVNCNSLCTPCSCVSFIFWLFLYKMQSTIVCFTKCYTNTKQDKTSDLNVPAEWEGVRSWALQLFLWGPSGLQLPQVDTELGTS